MMITIKQVLITLLVSFAVFFFMPVVSFASDSDIVSDIEKLIPAFDYDDFLTHSSDGTLNGNFTFDFDNTINYLGGGYTTYDGGGFNQNWYVNLIDINQSYIFGIYYKDIYYWNKGDLKNTPISMIGLYYFGSSLNVNSYYALNILKRSGSSRTGSTISFVPVPNRNINGLWPISDSSSGSSVSGPGLYISASVPVNIPVFNSLNDALNFYQNGDLSNIVNSSDNGWGESASPKSLGFIKPSYYLDNHVGSSGDYEIITWASTSTTGVDLTDSRYNVQFALRDKSYTMSAGEKAKINFDTYPNMVEGIGTYLGRKIYNFSHDNVNNAILRGDAVPMSTYNNMVSLGITSASSRRFAFNAMNEYSNSPNFQAAHPEIAANLNNVINANVQEFIPGGFLQRIFNDSNLRNLADFQLSYDIYARISDSTSGTKGNWLLIDKHGRPVKNLENVLNGGSTIRPVKVPDFEPSSDFTSAPDDEDIPDEELDENDTVKDEPLPTGYIDPSSGDGVNNYYNYTYNYDNRTWIENHYDNQTVEEVNEGLEWIKMFPGFFGLFLKFFGAFLPGWAVVCVTIAIPIIIGLLIFKAIKGVIPFV